MWDMIVVEPGVNYYMTAVPDVKVWNYASEPQGKETGTYFLPFAPGTVVVAERINKVLGERYCKIALVCCI